MIGVAKLISDIHIEFRFLEIALNMNRDVLGGRKQLYPPRRQSRLDNASCCMRIQLLPCVSSQANVNIKSIGNCIRIVRH